jgi:hypothetical protein
VIKALAILAVGCAAIYGVLSALDQMRVEPVIARPAPDHFQVLSSVDLSATETLRLVHVPDQITGLRCLIYTNSATGQAHLQCDDDLRR